ncbi:hypothetical protein GCM10022295_91100 [Streptomyces osmaniensis]|uniref:Transposase IS204/IS1001/IS1096/IS1165 DDE domain-containing protein n=1 Tax=Streptomyces osmaniensis TaxID=593134 RepID=A0ABP6Z1C2_9ACTN|nr:transposase [Streptomyces sp. JCM17656]
MDADTRLPIELWAGRDAERLAAWLRQHPGVEVVCRDGSLVYRQGITDGAPDAVQVSDRFHLWQGLSKRVSDIAAAHRDCMPAAVPEANPPSQPPPADGAEAADTPANRHAKRLFEAVHAACNSGCSLSAMAREVGLNRRTAAKYSRAASWQECVRRTPPRRSTNLDPYLEYLRQRWEEGEHTATVLTRRSSPRATGATTSASKWPSPRCVGACQSIHRASDRPRPGRWLAGSPPRHPDVACTSPRHSDDYSSTARNWTKPTTWYDSSPPCSTPTMPPC